LAIKAEFNLAWACKILGKPEKAITYFEELAKEFPESELAVASHYQVADTLYKQGRYVESRDKYAQVSSAYPRYNSADFALFQAGYISFYNLDDREAAAKYFSELGLRFPQSGFSIEANTTVTDTMVGGMREEGFRMLREKKYNEALGYFEKALEIAPLDTLSLSGMGLGYYWLNDKEAALDKAERTSEISSAQEIAIINTLFIYINSGKVDAAIELGERIISRYKREISRPELYYNLGYAYILNGAMDKAVDCFVQALNLNPDFIFAYNNLGCALWSIERYSRAVKAFKEALDLDLEYADAHYNLGVAYFYMKRFEDAYRQFEKAIEINPRYQEARSFLDRIKQILHYQP